MVKIALAQFGCTQDKEDNLRKISGILRRAAAKGSQILCLPELSSTIYFCNGADHAHFDLAEPIPGPSTEQVAAVAEETGMLVIFPMFEKTIEGEFYNTAAILGPRGELLGRYRKTMIPYSPRPGANHVEKFYFRPGNIAYPVFDTPFGVKIGVVICYDRHFPEPVRCLALNGADIVFIPSAAGGAMQSLWELELRAHAAFNLLYVAGVNKAGPEIGQVSSPFFGNSMLVNTRAEIVARAGVEDEIVYGEVNAESIQSARRLWGFYRDRRPDLYSALVQ